MIDVAQRLIAVVENYSKSIGRSDYTQNYYGWDFHLVAIMLIRKEWIK